MKKGKHTMNAIFSLGAVSNGAKRIAKGLVLAVAVTFLHQDAKAITTIDLGWASSFAVLAYSGITDAGGVSMITGNVGLSPTTGAGITGLTALHVGGTIYTVDGAGPLPNVTDSALLTKATGSLGLSGAFTDAFGRTPTTPSYGTTDKALDGLSLISGVYNFGHAATANLTTTLTLDAQGDPNAVWIFQATSDLVTGSGSKVVFLDGVGSPCNVFWVVGSKATLGTHTDFVGNIMAYSTIELDAYATLMGSALAENEAVTLDHNIIYKSDCTAVANVPDAGSTLLLLGSGLATLLAFRQRFFSLA